MFVLASPKGLLTNDDDVPVVNETNGTGTHLGGHGYRATLIWASNSCCHKCHEFPQATVMIQRLRAMTMSVSADNSIDAHFQTLCSSTDDANLLGAALQAGILYRRYQQAQSQPELASALDQVRVTPSGDRLKIDIPLSHGPTAFAHPLARVCPVELQEGGLVAGR